MRREEDEKLWDLLGHAAKPEVSPFFARNVVRRIREGRGEGTARRWFSLRWLVPAAGLALAIIAALSLRVQMPDRTRSISQPQTLALIETQDSELIADLDDLVTSDDGNTWDDVVLL
jgi:hypothetical protein